MSLKNKSAVLVLVPAYNAEKYLEELVGKLRAYVCDDNLLVINDGSRDGTAAVLEKLGVKHVNHDRNSGKGAALITGFEYAVDHNYRSVLTIDADLQHPPEALPGFFALDDGATLVIGTRRIKLSVMPFSRCLTNYLTSLIISIFSSRRVRDSQSGFRLIPTSLLKAIPLRTVGYDLESEMLFKAGALGVPIAEVAIRTIYEGSQSYIHPISDTNRFVRQIWRRIWA